MRTGISLHVTLFSVNQTLPLFLHSDEYRQKSTYAQKKLYSYCTVFFERKHFNERVIQKTRRAKKTVTRNVQFFSRASTISVCMYRDVSREVTSDLRYITSRVKYFLRTRPNVPNCT